MKEFLVLFLANDNMPETSIRLEAISFVAAKQHHLVYDMIADGCKEYIYALLIVCLDDGEWKIVEI